MTNKTAVDILIEDLLSGKLIEVLSNKVRYKEIVRQQIIDAFTAGQISIAETLFAEYKERGFHGDITIPENDKEDGEEYYQQTFGNSQNTQQ